MSLCLTGSVVADLFSPSQSSIDYKHTSFPVSYHFNNRTFELSGTSLLRYKHIFKLYTGALYLDAGESGDLQDRAKRFEVVYLRNLNGLDLVDAGAENLVNKFGRNKISEFEAEFNRMNTWWDRQFMDGDRAAISFIPGKGTSLEINGELQGWVGGDDFARLYFSIWLGPDEVCENFKADLLTKSN